MKKFLFLLMTVFCAAAITAQTRTVTGIVTAAEDGEPLAGATVVPVGGSGQGTATDLDGHFTLQVPQNVTKLHVSYVGMISQEVTITPGEMHIVLVSGESRLNEVMVVAYGTATKASFTGSAAVVGEAELEKTTTSNALNAINGKVAGVQMFNDTGQPGENTPTIRIRGISSIYAGNSPLIVVDGTPYPGDLGNINPNDIASMTVLKDAASNALYGARGANGVILVTTKKAQMGNGGKVTLDVKVGGNSKATPEYKTVKDPRAYYEMYYSALYNYGVDQGFSNPYLWAVQNMTAQNDYGLSYQTYTVPTGQYLIGTNGKFNPNATEGYLYTSRTGQQFWLQPDNYLDAAYKNSVRQEYNLSITNSTERSQFYLSSNYLNNEGIVPNSNYERFTSRLAADSQIKPWLKVGGDLSYTWYSSKMIDEDGVSNSSANIFVFAQQIAPIYPLYVRDAEKQRMYTETGVPMYDYGDAIKYAPYISRPFYTGSNAISDAILNTSKYNGNAFSAQGYFEITFLKDFKFTSNNSMNFDSQRYTSIQNPYFGNYATSNGILYKYSYQDLSYTFQQLLNWTHTFNDVHEVSILAGHENYWRRTAMLNATKSNMFDPDNEELAGAITEVGSNSYRTEYNNEGWLFRAQYNYDEKYFISGSYRRDASSRFAPDKRWGNFWSLGGAWIISKENWFDASWVDMLKVKVSYGEQGNDNINDFLYVDTYEVVNSMGNPSATPYQKGNPDITWETGGNLNYGVEFDFFNSRLSGSIEGFYRKTSDMLNWFPLPPSYGWTGYYANIGDMTNKGIEIDLSAVLVQTKDIQWSVNGNLTWYKNKITYLPEERKQVMNVDGVPGYSSGSYYYGEGIPLYTYRLIKYAGPDPQTGEATYWHTVTEQNLADGLYAGAQVGDQVAVPYGSVFNNDDYHLCGSAIPTTYGGFGTTLTAYGFDLSLNFNFSLGGKIYDSSYATYMGTPTSSSRGFAFHEDLYNAWTPENTNTDIPRLQYGDQYTTMSSDRFLIKSNYLNLQNINFGYSLPKKVVNKMKLDKLRFYLQCENVCYWAARKGLDPRQSITGSNTNTFYAPIRTISGGVTVSF